MRDGEPSFDQLLFGLRVRAPLAIPYAPPLFPPAAPDLILHIDALPPWLEGMPREPYFRDDEPRLTVDRCANGAFLFRYPDGTEFVVANAEIWMRWQPPLIFEDASTYLSGPILAFVMRLRGAVCLHASAVDIDGHAIAIAGSAGAGKSTLAAALVAEGATLIAEDVVAMVSDGESVLCIPSYAGIRLWPESAELLFGDRDALPSISPTWDKRMLETPTTAEPRPLAAIYHLERGDETLIAELEPRDALIRLVACSYRGELLDAPMRRREFDLLTAAATTLPLRLLTRGLERDPRALARLVTQDAKMHIALPSS